MLPLQNFRVIDVSPPVPASLTSMLLGDFGADVIKIEHPDIESGNRLTWSYPNYNGMSSIFASFNRNKKSITLDLKRRHGKEIFLKLCSTSDVVVEGFRPGITDKYRIGYQDVKKINQNIIYCSLSGYGKYSPYQNKAGHDINFVGQSGVLSLNGNIGNKPSLPGYFIADFSGSMMATIAILIAIINRSIKNTSQHIDISLLDSIISLIGFSFLTGIAGGTFPHGNELLYNGKAAFYNIYETMDSRHLIVAAMERKFWNNFCLTLGRDDLCSMHEDESKQKFLINVIAEIIRGKTLREWLEIFTDVDACVSPVLTLEEVINSDHLKSSGLIKEIKRIHDSAMFKQIDNPINFSDIKKDTIRMPPPLKGEHTDSVLSELGYSVKEIRNFRNKNII